MEAIPAPLRAHARTMALSLRFLLGALREPLGLGYLLARASDTIADSGRMPREERVAWLEGIQGALATPSLGAFRPVNFPEALTPAEYGLLECLPNLLALLGESPEREELIGLWREILEGQLFDLRRFTPGSDPLDHAELERYCGLVAGSVGASWTRLIERRFPRMLLRPAGEMIPLGMAYGKGLQLVNVLRDRAEDRAAGRRYVREEDLPELVGRAEAWLRLGERYLSGLRPGRILTASSLPLDLAVPTLDLIGEHPGAARLKLTRRRVRGILLRSAFSLWLPRRVDPAS